MVNNCKKLFWIVLFLGIILFGRSFLIEPKMIEITPLTEIAEISLTKEKPKHQIVNIIVVGDKGTKIAFLAFTNLGSPNWRATASSSGMAWLTKENLKQGVKLAKEKADIVMVSFHLGEEYQAKPNYDQKYFSHLAIQAGADLIIGHHPHVVQKNERYKQGYIFYSLGNFVFDQSFSTQTMKGQMVKILVQNDKIKEVV